MLNEQKLTLLFNAVLAFDLADAKVAAPPNVASITQRADADTSAIDLTLIGEVDVHSFREEKNYIIDVAFQQPEKPAAETHAQAHPNARAGQAVGRSGNRPRQGDQGVGPAAAAAAGRASDVGDLCRAGQDRDQAGTGGQAARDGTGACGRGGARRA